MAFSQFVPISQLKGFMAHSAMNSQYGFQAFVSLDPKKAQALLPPPLQITEPCRGYVCVVDIREPTFSPYYMEASIGILARMGDVSGIHFLGLQLSGPGAQMGVYSGREFSGLPKKLCERIHVERSGDEAHCFVERGGVRLLDVKLHMGKYNQPDVMRPICAPQEAASREHPFDGEGACLLFRYTLANKGFENMVMTLYDSVTRYYQWEPASAEIVLTSSQDDPWGELPVTGVLGAGWMVSDNFVRGQRVLHQYKPEEAYPVMQYLFRGRFDHCTLCQEHQIFE